MNAAVAEVTIDLETALVRQWGMEVGNPHDSAPAVVLFTADDVHQSLRDGTVTCHTGTYTVSRDGIVTTTRYAEGDSHVYELFPARFSDDDDEPYEPLCYVGRWPD